MVDERRLTISSSSHLYPDEVARRTFATARRGFEPTEVRTYLEQVARDMVAAMEREQELRELLTDAERRAQNPVLDEATLTSALGHETARVLRSAHEASADLVGRAETDANRMLTEAQEEAGKLQARAEEHASERAAQSEAAASEIRQRAQEEAAAKVDAARAEAESLVEQARAECRAMLSEAQELRARVLGDLTRRRRVLHSQIEQLRAGRDRLAETIGGVRHAVDRVTDELFRAEDEARIAAETAGRQLALQTDIAHGTREGEQAPAESTAIAEPPGAAVSEAAAPEVVAPAAVAAGPSAPSGSAPEEMGTPAPRGAVGTQTTPTVPAPVAAPLPGPEEIGTVVPPEDASAQTSTRDVEELFARLRAERSAVSTVSHDAPTTTSVKEHGEEPARGRQRRETVPAETSEHGGEPDHDRIEEAVTVTAPAGHLDEAAPSEAEREAVLMQRDEVLGPVVATLARRLKRALSDDQNDILDRLRARKGWSPDVLPDEAEHIERYARAGWEQLAEAARTGATFAGGRSDDAPGIEDIASDLAEAIVLPLRRRLEEDGAGVDSGDEAGLVEQVGAAFRDWKGARVERLAGDEATAAFSRAALASTEPGVSLRWVVDDGGAECPDCDDNALAGPVPRGEAFPTGHPHPPAHAGCRCLLAPLDA